MIQVRKQESQSCNNRKLNSAKNLELGGAPWVAGEIAALTLPWFQAGDKMRTEDSTKKMADSFPTEMVR